MLKILKKLSFRGKILCTYLVLILLMILVFVIFYINSVSSAMTYNMEYMKQANVQMNMSFDNAMGNGNSLNYIHLLNNKLNIILHESVSAMDAAAKYERQLYVQETLKMLTITNPNILRVTAITAKGDLYCSINYISEDYIEEMREELSSIPDTPKNKRYFTEVMPQKIGDSSYSMVTVKQRLFDIGEEEPFAYLLVDLDFGSIANDFNMVLKENDTQVSYAIINQENVLYNSRDSFLNLETSFEEEEEKKDALQSLSRIGDSQKQESEITIHGVPCMVSVLKNESTGWYMVHYVPKESLMRNSMENLLPIMLWSILILVISGILSCILSKQISKPIKQLTRTMAQARQGEVKPYEDKNEREDEIGQLINIYNLMGQRINDSIVKLYVAQINQKETELKMLQFQINPHFLYNSLNTVSAIARLRDIEEIPQITESLSDMFRYNIKGSDFVSLRDELTQLKNYLNIQNIRFPNRFQVEFDIDEELLDIGVIKFVLQPIVENSIEHAFGIKRAKDTLRISARRIDEQLILKIYDDGCGMPVDKVEQLNEVLSKTNEKMLLDNTSQGIGLKNVNARLKNFYGKDYGITVSSVEGEFTCIQMLVCIKEHGNHEERGDLC